MSTRHIVRVSPLHISILLTVIYVIFALIVMGFGTLLALFTPNFSFAQAFADISSGAVISGIALNLVLVFIGSFLLTLIYNWLAQYLGGIEITLDDD